MKIAGTGHRPNKLGGYSDQAFDKLYDIAWGYLSTNIQFINQVISGMALGWDQALAKAAIDLNISTIAAIPFKGQEIMWQKPSIKLYNDLLEKCSEIVIVSEGKYSPHKMHLRNEWMVDNCDILLAMWNGDKFGGTYNCISYAKKKLDSDNIINLYSELNN